MERTLKLVGKTSNEIFTLRYPTTLLDFCEYDFSYFAEHSIDLCNESLKSGVEDHDRMAELRRDIQPAHCFIEHNIRTVYEKVVLDCWIDYVCRRDNIGTNALPYRGSGRYENVFGGQSAYRSVFVSDYIKGDRSQRSKRL